MRLHPLGGNWVHGLRRQDDLSVATSKEWMETVYRRITGELLDLESGENTEKAEDILGIGRHVYYYVEACEPRFGHLIVAHRNLSPNASSAAFVTPFDTGGLALGKAQLVRPMSRADRAALVTHHTYPSTEFRAKFRAWIKTAFSRRTDYWMRNRPKYCVVADIDIRKSRSPAWLWEARLAKRDYAGPPVYPVRIFMRSGDKMRYLAWFRNARLLHIREARAHVKHINRIVVEVSSPIDAVMRFLETSRVS